MAKYRCTVCNWVYDENKEENKVYGSTQRMGLPNLWRTYLSLCFTC